MWVSPLQAALIYLTGIFVLGIVAQWLAWRLRLPAILLLLGFGFAAGQFDVLQISIPQEFLLPIVSLSVAVIMFEGGLSLRLEELRDAAGPIVRLVIITLLITWALGALAAWLVLDFPPRLALLLGAILVVSGPTVIVPLLRHIRPSGRIGSIVKWEGIVNDPVGAVLAVLVFEAVLVGEAAGRAEAALWGLAATLVIGFLVAFSVSGVLIMMLRRFWIPDYLHNAVFLASVVGSFTVSNLIQAESGLFTVTLIGVILANQKTVQVKHVIEFKENLRVLLISVLFILLASRVSLADLLAVGWEGLLFLALLLLVVRPLAVWLALIGSELNQKERIFLCWLAPRGIVAAAVSSLFALEITTHGAGHLPAEVLAAAEMFVPITFLVIVGTVTVYGLSAAPLARFLGLAQSNPQGILFAGAAPFVREIATVLQREGVTVLLVDTNYANLAAARMAGLPTCYASILSEYFHDEQELTGIGRLLAMTPNDEVNSLATIEFAEWFDRAEVYRLPSPPVGQRRSPSAHMLPGRQLFDAQATYAHLANRFAAGGQIKITLLTEDFTYEDFCQRHGDYWIPLFVINGDGRLTVATVENPPKPTRGQRLISFVDVYSMLANPEQ